MQINPGASLLLKGVVGSTAFGLNHEGSDKDYQGIFVVSTEMLLGLDSKVQESYSFFNPDTTYHEVGKFCRLALGCNPTVLDLLWLNVYNVRTQLGTDLINMRSNLLSAPKVRGAYFGYASDQLGKLLKDERPEKRAKNARHFARLLHQGYQLYSTGTYSIKLEDPQWFFDFGKTVGYDLNVQEAKDLLSSYEDAFNSEDSALPEKPNKEPLNEWLLEVRHQFYQHSN
jgi:uncharacterized protein